MVFQAKPFSEAASEHIAKPSVRKGKYRDYIDLKDENGKPIKISYQLPVLQTTNGFCVVETTNTQGEQNPPSYVMHFNLGKEGERSADQQSVVDTLEKFKESMYNNVTKAFPQLAKLPKAAFLGRSKCGMSESFTQEMESTGHTIRLVFPPHQTWTDNPNGEAWPSGKVKQVPETDYSRLSEPLRDYFKVPLAQDKDGEIMGTDIDSAKAFLSSGYNLRAIVQIEKISVLKTPAEAHFNVTWKVAGLVRLDRDEKVAAARGQKRGNDRMIIAGFNDDVQYPSILGGDSSEYDVELPTKRMVDMDEEGDNKKMKLSEPSEELPPVEDIEAACEGENQTKDHNEQQHETESENTGGDDSAA